MLALNTSHMTDKKPNKLNIALWIAQCILAVLFLMSGVMKAAMPIDELALTTPWVTALPAVLIRIIGICEVTGAVALLLPSVLRYKPRLTPIAATGLSVIMISSILFHVSRGEMYALISNVIFLVLAAFIAWGRFTKGHITPKARGERV